MNSIVAYEMGYNFVVMWYSHSFRQYK